MNRRADPHKLPGEWDMIRVDEATHFNPKREAVEANDDDQFTFVPMSAVGEEFAGIDTSQSRPFAEVKKGYTQFKPGDVLSAKITPCMENGKIAVVPPLPSSHGYGSTEFTVLRPKDGVEAKWVAYYLFRQQFRSDAQRAMTGSAGQLRVPKKWLADQQIPVAPHDQQQRIVAKIEELFSDLDAGVAALERVQANLQRYRASVLKAAVDGRLTQQWRAEHPDVEPADELLQHILRQRREKWKQAELAKYEAKGKTPPKNWQSKYKEPAAPDTTNLPELPEGWCWATVSQLAAVQSGQTPTGIKDRLDPNGRLHWFKVGDMNEDSNSWFMTSATSRLSEEVADELGLHRAPAGTIIFPKRGGAIATNKKRLLAFESSYDLNTMGVSPHQSIASYFFWWFATVDLRRISDGSNVPQLNHDDIGPLPVPLPPAGEQGEIVDQIEHAISSVEAQAEVVRRNIHRAPRLRQAILKRAFEGKLATDQPAPDAEANQPAGTTLWDAEPAAPGGARAR